MSELPVFSEHYAVEAWFNTQPQEVCNAVAARAALRVFPAVLIEGAFHEPGLRTKAALDVLRCGLVSAAAATCPATETKVLKKLANTAGFSAARFAANSAANSAAFSAANSAANSTAQPAHSIALSADSAADSADSVLHSAARSAAYSATNEDAWRAIVNVSAVFMVRLWAAPSEVARELDVVWQTFLTDRAGDPVWDFWLRWYQAIWDGTPMDWALTREVALIGDDVWKEGPEAVAEAIRGIERKFKTDIAERLVLNEITGKHDVADEEDLERDILEFVQERIMIALKTALAADSGNGLQETSPETSEIRDGLASKNPSVVAATFYAASVSISCKLKDGAYPDDVSLRNLKNALYGAKEEICEAHPKARERCERLAALGQPPSDIGNDDRTMIEGLVPAMFDQLEPRAMEIYQSDVERILSEKGATRLSWARVSNWTTIISGHIDNAMKNDKRAKWLADVASRLWKLWQGGE